MIFLRNIFLILLIFFSSFFVSKYLYASTSFVQLSNSIKKFNSFYDRSAYALGASLGNYINYSFDEQKKIGVILNKDSLLLGIRDSLVNKSIFSEKEISKELMKLEERLKHAEEIVFKKDTYSNEIQGKRYIKQMLMKKNAKRTSSGLVFFIEKRGKGRALQDSDIITIHYKGFLIDGSEFDNSYKHGKPLSFPLESVISGWKEGLRYIRKGGKIKLIVPPQLAYGESNVHGILGNSTLVFEIELIDVKSK